MSDIGGAQQPEQLFFHGPRALISQVGSRPIWAL